MSTALDAPGSRAASPLFFQPGAGRRFLTSAPLFRLRCGQPWMREDRLDTSGPWQFLGETPIEWLACGTRSCGRLGGGELPLRRYWMQLGMASGQKRPRADVLVKLKAKAPTGMWKKSWPECGKIKQRGHAFALDFYQVSRNDRR